MSERESGELDAGNSGEKSSQDDKFDDELRALTEGTAGEARFNEPTAAEREKLARRARKERAADAKLYAKLEKEATKKLRKERRKARRRHLVKRSAWTLSALVLVGAAVFAYVRFHPASGSGGSTSPGIAAVSPLTESGPGADPFQGTSSDTWAGNAAGITVPAARPAGSYSASQVTAAYQATRKLLIAGNLDRQTLNGGTPTAFAALLTKEQRAQFLGGLNKKGLSKAGEALSTRKWVTSFYPGSARFIGNVIKVHGTMSASATTVSGSPVLAVTVNYIFVYPVQRPGVPSDWMRVLVHQYGAVQFASWDDPGGSLLQPWDSTVSGSAGGLCGMTDGFIHPDYPSMRYSKGGTGSGPAINPYSDATSAPGGGSTCGATTGT